jgi:magnesium transporter
MLINIIDSFHLDDMKNISHPSVFFQHDAYDMIILRLPYLNQQKEVDYTSKAFIITEDTYYFFNKTTQNFENLQDIKGFYKLLDTSVDATLQLIENYMDTIEQMEDNIYENKSIKNFNQQWFITKNDLIRINRVLSKCGDVFTSIIRSYKKEDDFLELHFEDLNEHIQRAQRNTAHLLEKLDSIYNFHLTQTNEQMNRIIYVLTLLSGIFLPLNLIVGFFGMNTSSLPFTQGNGGTFSVLFLLGTTALIATLITLFMKKR